jgi:hypothetical protein
LFFFNTAEIKSYPAPRLCLPGRLLIAFYRPDMGCQFAASKLLISANIATAAIMILLFSYGTYLFLKGQKGKVKKHR